MKMFKVMAASILGVAFCLGFTACSDDDENGNDNGGGNTTTVVNPEKVFTGGLPKSVSGMSISKNEEGLVTSISTKDGEKAVFEYFPATTKADVAMNRAKITVTDEEGDVTELNLQLNSDGYVVFCNSIDHVGTPDASEFTWEMKYDTEGHLIEMRRSESDGELTRITYKDGDVAVEPDNALTQELFNKIKAAGFKSVRLPVTWFGHIGAAPDYVIDDRLERVAEIVGYAEKAGLNIIINIHHDGAGGDGRWLDFKAAANSEEKNAEIVEQFTRIWTQIAERFVNTGNFLIFESMNEVHDGGWGFGGNLTDGGHQYRLITEWNQAFINAVRETGGENATRYLGIPGMCGNWQMALEHLELPDDPTYGRLLVSVHCYDPMDFSYEDGNKSYYTEWGHTASEDKKSPTGIDEKGLNDIFRQLKEKFVDNNVPVYIGEMTCTNRETEREEAFRRYYLEYYCKSAHDNGLTPFYWDDSGTGIGLGQSGIFNRATGEFVQRNEQAVEVMLRAVSDNAPKYTLQSIYDRAPEKED